MENVFAPHNGQHVATCATTPSPTLGLEMTFPPCEPSEALASDPCELWSPKPTIIEALDADINLDEPGPTLTLGTYSLTCGIQDLTWMNLRKSGQFGSIQLKAAVEEEERRRARKIPIFGGAFDCRTFKEWSKIAFEEYYGILTKLRSVASCEGIELDIARGHFDHMGIDCICGFAMMLVSDVVRVRSIVLTLCKPALTSGRIFIATTATDEDDRKWVNALQEVSCADPTGAPYEWWHDLLKFIVSGARSLLPPTHFRANQLSEQSCGTSVFVSLREKAILIVSIRCRIKSRTW